MSSSVNSHAVVGIQDELVYDFLISLDAEIRLVWKAPWKFGKLLYFLTRYLAFGGAIVTIFLNRSRFTSLGTCKALSKATASEVILSLRVWALWGNSWKVACLLAIGFLIPMPIMAFSVLLRDSQYHYNTLSDSDFYESITHNQFGLCPLLLGNANDTIMLFAFLMIYETSQSGGHTSFVFKFFLHGLTYNILTLGHRQPYILSSHLTCFYIFVKKQWMQPYLQLNSVRVCVLLLDRCQGFDLKFPSSWGMRDSLGLEGLLRDLRFPQNIVAHLVLLIGVGNGL
ncbi:hypothetical protein K435DRAFT_811025 [Dendrothele bispora CBS 962.96]|uniref:DUF6533 domain-containing protein n=1 Tax=Dendrothele bispora (strain CBS 962.96) TaxID=1314807 RepID=A0A4S8KTJ8_DENBC|nr:hypothetical protein K435DRAFT_811025 [Dendrothele bispora CBS 962.96]